MEPLPSVEPVQEGSMEHFTATEEEVNRGRASSLSVQLSSPPTSRSRPRSSRSKTRSRSPYIDRFGLQQPPPPSNLYGGENVHPVTRRREYFEEEQKLLPFHHDPETYVPSERACLSTAAVSAIQEATEMKEVWMQQSLKDHVDYSEHIRYLECVATFAHRSCFMKKSPSDPRSMEGRMEDLLKEYSFDRMRPPKRKVEGAQAAEPYVPYPDGRNVECQRSPGHRRGEDWTR
ncbi:MAG: hypothetical protein Q9172_000223 [Xanthocarpia lactea]